MFGPTDLIQPATFRDGHGQLWRLKSGVSLDELNDDSTVRHSWRGGSMWRRVGREDELGGPPGLAAAIQATEERFGRTRPRPIRPGWEPGDPGAPREWVTTLTVNHDRANAANMRVRGRTAEFAAAERLRWEQARRPRHPDELWNVTVFDPANCNDVDGYGPAVAEVSRGPWR